MNYFNLDNSQALLILLLKNILIARMCVLAKSETENHAQRQNKLGNKKIKKLFKKLHY